ncbi:MAG: hypothetical protein IJW34_01870 [Clostridia bacterium]|nr:hypothetical protein [Clostridia bacterium]
MAIRVKSITKLFLVLCIVSVLLQCWCVLAAGEESEKSILDVIRDQEKMGISAPLYQKELYPEEMAGMNLDDQPVLTVLNAYNYGWAEWEMDKIIENALNNAGYFHVIFSPSPISIGIQMNQEEEPLHLNYNPREWGTKNEIPTYITDLVNGAIYKADSHVPEGEYSRVVCFDDYYGGAVVYYLKGENTVVCCYDSKTSGFVDYPLEEYREYAIAYEEWRRAEWEKNGDRAGVDLTFNEFVDDVKNGQRSLEKTHSVVWWIIAILGMAVVAAGGMALYLFHRRSIQRRMN